MPSTPRPTTGQVLAVARLAMAHPDADGDRLAALLRDAGFAAADADRASVFVPAAFARPFLPRLGLEAEQLPRTYRVQDAAGTWHERPLADEPWYEAAMIVAVATVTHGYAADGCTGPTASRAEVEALLALSADMNAVGQALDEQVDLTGATLHPLQVHRWQVPAPPRRWQFWRG